MKTTSLPTTSATTRPGIINKLALLLWLVPLPCCFGQTDTNLLGTGDWSETVTDSGGEALRGRLLAYGGTSQEGTDRARVYLELQNASPGIWMEPIELYFEHGGRLDLKFEMRDQHDHPIESSAPPAWVGPPPKPFRVTVPRESTMRLRADAPFVLGTVRNREGVELKYDGLKVSPGIWVIPPKATNDFYLTAAFTPPTGHPSPLNYHVWQGTLKLPKVKIPAPRP